MKRHRYQLLTETDLGTIVGLDAWPDPESPCTVCGPACQGPWYSIALPSSSERIVWCEQEINPNPTKETPR